MHGAVQLGYRDNILAKVLSLVCIGRLKYFGTDRSLLRIVTHRREVCTGYFTDQSLPALTKYAPVSRFTILPFNRPSPPVS
jgi:hypothetical protein